ncbi:cysteate racemase [Lutispora saccharofermentans]|uniref:Amino acid racemase n=1 Tax=Lutispora saccharofermentans TaxID=3024236 RepID=A0ABT1NII4_9FIRM|nr:amino acid racemase [Lutispora saccharofermentans]MCQ1531083.1 amino acid racemase [Lutispora saccharofermentans]
MILGIMGGMGPAATCDLFRKIIDSTHASKDQDHIHIVIDSNAQIPDRTQYILGEGQDPKIELIRSLTRLEMLGADYIAMPCNTAHFFYDDIKRYTKAYLINMIGETAAFLKFTKPDAGDFLLLATEGTYISGIYKKIFKEYGLNIIEPDDADKKVVMGWIYKVKSGKFDVSPTEFEYLVTKYIDDKCTPVILGCTELPLLVERIGVPKEYIDPVLILARHCVELAEKEKFDEESSLHDGNGVLHKNNEVE